MKQFLLALIAFAVGVQSAELTELRIVIRNGSGEGASWSGWETYDLAEFELQAVWSDGVSESRGRAGTPVWITDYGWFEPIRIGMDRLSMLVPSDSEQMKTTQGNRVVWSAPFRGSGKGTVSVKYAGKQRNSDSFF